MFEWEVDVYIPIPRDLNHRGHQDADTPPRHARRLAQKGPFRTIGQKPPSGNAPESRQVDVMDLKRTQGANSGLIRLIPMLSKRARKLAHNAAEADDLVQDTLLSLCQRMKTADRIDDLPAYAMRTLSNQARRGWRRMADEELHECDAATPPEAEGRLAYADTLDAIARLPDAQRILMELVAAGEPSPTRLADQTGVPINTVMSRLARARAKLRLDLDARDT